MGRHRIAPQTGRISIFALCIALAGTAVGSPPDLELNPVTGFVESVDIAAGSGDRVRHVIDRGKGSSSTVALISSDAGSEPRIAIAGDGDSWVVWWEDSTIDEVYVRARDESAGTWSAPTRVSDPSEDSHAPEIATFGTDVWVTYEVDEGSSVSIVSVIVDDPQPIPLVVAETTFTGNVDVLLHAEQGHLWLTWVDSSTAVGWSEWDPGSEDWSTPAFESYTGQGTSIARETIRDTVLDQ